MRYTLFLVALLTSGCASAPGAPTQAAPARLSLVVSGQSNAGYTPNAVYPLGWAGLGESLMPLATVRRVAQGGLAISGFGQVFVPRWQNDQEWLWPALSTMLAQPDLVDAFVWVHGESDATDDALEPLYYAAASDLFRRVRTAARQPNLLIVITGLPCYCTPGAVENGDSARWDRMRAVQQQLARDVPHAAYINTMDLQNGGGQHYSSGGYEMLAQRVVEAVTREKR